MNNQEKINIFIDSERWVSDDGSFYVYNAIYDHMNVGVSTPGFQLRRGNTTLVGIWTEYRGSPSFKADYEEIDESSYEAQFNILCSINGIKDMTARKILDNIPDNNIEIFYNDEIPKIKGIGPKTIEKIHQGLNFLRNNAVLKELIALLGNYISSAKIHKLHKHLIDNKISMSDFRKDPYKILMENAGFKFPATDKLAQEKLNCSPTLDSRVNYLGEYTTKNILLKSGSTFTDYDNFKENMSNYDIDVNKYNDLFKDEDSKITIDNDIVQLKNIADAEINIPIYLDKYKQLTRELNQYELKQIDEYIEEYENTNKIKLHDTQKAAVITSISKNASIICGGAGTGKSTIIKCIIHVLNKLNNSTVCIAPTGKAARRMSEVTQQNAYTCHRFFLRELDEFNTNPIPWVCYNDCTLIIDEFSMVDTLLFHNVLEAAETSINKFNRIILIGDPGQLPSVGAGKVMTDIINNQYIDLIELTKTFRQEGNSNIIDMSYLVRNRNPLPNIKENDFFITCQNMPTEYILKCYKTMLEKMNDLDDLYDDFQICTSTNRRAGIINQCIQNTLMHTVLFKFKKHELSFGLNDKIMCIENDYDNDIYNGEFGRVIGFRYISKDYLNQEHKINDPKELQDFYLSSAYLNNKVKDMQFEVFYKGLNRHVLYDMDWNDINKFRPSYCTTIHKLQGSEFKYVLCDLSDFNPITDSRLLYTAITRAKKLFVLVSSNMRLINKVAVNPYSSKRQTLLFKH